MYLIVPYFAGDVDTFSALLFTDDMIMTLDIFTGVFLFHSSASVLHQFRISTNVKILKTLPRYITTPYLSNYESQRLYYRLDVY